jgi:serine/threonine protein kinase
MVALTVKSGGDEVLSATQSAAPADATSTSEASPTAKPDPSSGPAPRFVAPHVRNPDRYQMIAEHGRGGLGRVSRARDRELGRDVAIKELLSRGYISEVRFLREALLGDNYISPATTTTSPHPE